MDDSASSFHDGFGANTTDAVAEFPGFSEFLTLNW